MCALLVGGRDRWGRDAGLCRVVGGVKKVEVAVLYQQKMKNNVKRNTHKGRRKTKIGEPTER